MCFGTIVPFFLVYHVYDILAKNRYALALAKNRYLKHNIGIGYL
jgi:predicted DCC family thiol-disulfide oxidoreductase YuxK